MPNEVRSVQIVVPVRGAHEALKLCLACLKEHTDEERMIVVATTTAESRDVEDVALSVFGGEPPIWFTTSIEPQTFAQNCNMAAREGSAEILVFLNSDAFVGPGWLDALLAPFADPDVVAVGPMGTNVSGHQCIVRGGPVGSLDALGTVADVADMTDIWTDTAGNGTPYVARRLVGFCLAVRRSAWDEVGGFDERFENAFCDDDLSLRLSLVGDCVVVPDLLVLHAGSASFAELPDAEANYARVLAENEVRFREKWERRGLIQLLNAWFDYRGVR